MNEDAYEYGYRKKLNLRCSIEETSNISIHYIHTIRLFVVRKKLERKVMVQNGRVGSLEKMQGMGKITKLQTGNIYTYVWIIERERDGTNYSETVALQ